MEILSLPFEDQLHLKINPSVFASTQYELEKFLDTQKHLGTKTFAKEVMFSELKANNQIEGYIDDIQIIQEIIKRKWKDLKSEQAMRVTNLYHGYNYILKGFDINPETLKKLYSILSKGLLKPSDEKRMGEYYRADKVYIMSRRFEFDEGVEVKNIADFMAAYFDFLNNSDYANSSTSEYIKSQILHFYFVYIHPYFDVNGRTSRTLAMWYLLNKKAYPFIIFNRGITFKGQKYDLAIKEAKQFHNISFFIKYMLQTVQTELEKEYIMESISNNTSAKLNGTHYQTLLYLISMNGIITVKDFANIYNYYHEPKKIKEIYETMILPLVNMGILKVIRTTNSNMFNEIPNEVLEFNPAVLQYEKSYIRTLKKYQ